MTSFSEMGTYTGHDRIDHNVVFRLLPGGHDGFAQCRQRTVRIGLDHDGDANHVIAAITHTVLAVLRLVIVHFWLVILLLLRSGEFVVVP